MQNPQGVFLCEMCSFSGTDINSYNKHILSLHRNEGSFTVSCKSCPYKSTSYNAFRVHCSRQHRNLGNPQPNVPNLNEPLSEDSEFDFPHFENMESENDLDNQHSLNQSLGQFFLKLEARHGMSKSAINSIALEMQYLLNEVGGLMRKEISVAIERDNYNIDINSEAYDSLFNFSEIMNSFLNDKKRVKYFKDNFNLLDVNPIYMGKKLKKVKGKIAQKSFYGYTVPFLDNLRALIKTPDVKFWIENSHVSDDLVLRDWCDGAFYKEHQLKSPCLQIVLHVDDIETVNPIGVHRKIHKLTVFSYELANIPPQFRSRLHTKQLLAIAKSSDVKLFGMKPILTEFIEVLNSLKSGLDIFDDGKKYTGLLIGTLADTPALAQLWGTKEGVSFARKPCSSCEGERPQIFESFSESEFTLRTTENHLENCSILEEIISKAAKKEWSSKYGINNLSPLFMIEGISLDIALHDPMHVLLEGVILLELKAMLHDFIRIEKFFTLVWFNSQLELFDYSYLEINSKPTQIDEQSLSDKGTISLSASACLTIVGILPFILGQKVPIDNAKLLNFNLLIEIAFLSTSPFAVENSATLLAEAIINHHETFIREYPNINLTPKFHYLVHFPKQLLLFGPLRHHWCMRFEASFNVFKGRKWGSFKNIALSMCRYHLLRSCFFQNNCCGLPNENFLYSNDEFKISKAVHICDLDEVLKDICAPFFDDDFNPNDDTVYILKDLKVHGHEYRPGLTCLNLAKVQCESPIYAAIEIILYISGKKIFVVRKSTSSFYVKHLNSYEVQFSECQLVAANFDEIANTWPVPIRMFNEKKYVTNKYSCFINSSI